MLKKLLLLVCVYICISSKCVCDSLVCRRHIAKKNQHYIFRLFNWKTSLEVFDTNPNLSIHIFHLKYLIFDYLITTIESIDKSSRDPVLIARWQRGASASADNHCGPWNFRITCFNFNLRPYSHFLRTAVWGWLYIDASVSRITSPALLCS